MILWLGLWWFKKQVVIKLQIGCSPSPHPSPVTEGQRQRLKVEITIYWKQTVMGWETHSISNNINNKVYKREGALYTKVVHRCDLVLCGHQDKDKMVDALHGSCSPSLSLRQWKTTMNNETSQKLICLCFTTSSWTTGLGCGWQYLSWLLSTCLRLRWAWTCLHRALLPTAVSCTDAPVLPWAQLCLTLAAVLFLREGKGWAAVGQGGSLQGWPWQLPLGRRWNKMVPLPGCAHLFFPPKLHPRDEWVVQNSNVATPTQF